MSIEPYDLNFCTLLKELVNEGKVKQEFCRSEPFFCSVRSHFFSCKTCNIGNFV